MSQGSEPNLPKSPGTSNEVIEELLRNRIVVLEGILDADVLTYHGPMITPVDDLIRDAVESLTPKRGRIAVVLETNGGYIEVAERIAKVLRHHYGYVEFVIPNFAMSAGTVLVMSGDAIQMDYYSVLGPIDPQVQRADNGTWVPALGYLEKYDSLIKKSQRGKLTSAELTFLVEKFDPAELFRYEQERDLSISLLKEWLAQYKFKNWLKTETRGMPITEKIRVKRAEEIASALSNAALWHTHSRGIPMSVLRNQLKLQIEDFGKDAALNKAIREYDTLLTDYMKRRGNDVVLHTHETFQSFQG